MNIVRRQMLLGAGALLAAPRLVLAQTPFVVTPGQTEGPFYPTIFPADMDGDLVRVRGRAAQALGKITHVSGRVRDRKGGLVKGATVEIWQCDANGIYDHPGDNGQRRRDTAFQGYGRVQVDGDGHYAFRTIKPVPYPGRTPHIHFKVSAPGTGRLTTQMYVAGEPQNETDGVLRRVRDRQARESLIVRLDQGDDLEAGALKGSFDIVLDI
jgi:protocatechuate 3,4-dioxygenase beta subunit